jgi:hypothetical protein
MTDLPSPRHAEWETYEHVQAVENDPDFSQFLELIKLSVEGPPKVYVVDFDNAADATLDAPITEFCFARVKDATKNADLIDLLVRLGKELTAGPGCHGPAPSGTTKQESGTQVIIIGWDTVQVSSGVTLEVERGLKECLTRHTLMR